MESVTGEAGIRYLDTATVEACLPPIPVLLELASLALRSLVAGAEVPPKAAVGGLDGRFAHAMPARLDADAVPGGGASTDLLGMKWIAGGPANRAAGRPAMSALIVLSDPGSGRPVAILDGATITAWRTAALSGVAVGLFAAPAHGEAARGVLLGAGVQGAAHVAVLGSVMPGVELAIHDRHPERAEALAVRAATLAGIGRAVAVSDPAAAMHAADVLVTATSLGGRPDLGPTDVGPDVLVIPVDYGARITADLVRSAALFAVDDREQLTRNRRSGRLEGWPDATATLGDLLLGRVDPGGFGTQRPVLRPAGRAVALHQGPAVADVVVADAVLRTAIERGLGFTLPR